MGIEYPKQIAEDIIRTAKGLLRSYGVVGRSLFVIKEDVSQIDLGVMGKNVLSDFMKHVIDKDTQALLFVCQAVYSTYERKEDIPDEVDNADTTACILGILFTPEGTHFRRIPYVKGDEITIMDTGWQKADSTGGQIANPFYSK